MTQQTVLVAGASGVVGQAAIEAFAAAGWRVLGLSRRVPLSIRAPGFTHLAADLADPASLAPHAAVLKDVSRLAYAALYEEPALVSGWRNAEQMRRNDVMLANALDALSDAPLEHVSLLQGTKAYGAHIHRIPTPARERAPRDPHENFYWLQEDRLRAAAARRGFAMTVFRPQVIYGEALGGAMNLVPVIGAYAALRRAEGRPFSFPGGCDWIQEGVDAHLVGRALVWAATAPAARNETFNLTNGDVYVWRELWPALARALRVEPGPDEPQSMVAYMADRAGAWDRLVAAHDLRPVALPDLIGKSAQYADMLFGYGLPQSPAPALVSTIKVRQAGFSDCVDTEEMFPRLLARLAEDGFLPRP